jgi:hypothetical protein
MLSDLCNLGRKAGLAQGLYPALPEASLIVRLMKTHRMGKLIKIAW